MTEQERITLAAKDQWRTLLDLASKFAEDAPPETQLVWESVRNAFSLDYVEAVFSSVRVLGEPSPAYSIVFGFVPYGPGSETVERVELLDQKWTLEPTTTKGAFAWSVHPLGMTLTPGELIEKVTCSLSEFYKNRESAQ